jgi:hypothetical protein
MAEEQVQSQNGGEDKIEKNYSASLKKLVALLNGQGMKKTRLKKNEIADVVAELIKEKKEKALTEFKVEAIALLDKKVEFDKEVRRLEEEFKNKVNVKKKEFTESMQNLFKKVDNIDEIEKSYEESLSSIEKKDDK